MRPNLPLAATALALLCSLPSFADESPYIHNSIKYSDTGHQPATGRAGDISVATRALLGADGGTDVEVTTGTFDGGAPTGTLQRVQVKVGLHLEDPITHNFDASGTFTSLRLTGLKRNEPLRIQTSAQSADAIRTGVVTVDQVVKRRPDLRVQNVNAPPNGVEGHPLNFYVHVTETNGDMGARADCVMRVNGVEVDRASGIWVDARGSVTCAMSHTFATAGVQQVTFHVENVSPADWNPNNQRVGPINVNVRPVSQLVPGGSYVATATDRTRIVEWSSQGDETAPNWENEQSRDQERVNTTRLDAAFPAELDFDSIRVSLSEDSEGRLLSYQQSTTFISDDSARDYPYVNCVELNFGRTHSFFACVNNGATTIHYARGQSTTRYYSRRWGVYTNDWTGERYTFDHDMTMNRTFGGVQQYGSTVSMQLVAADADHVWQVEPFLVMEPWSSPDQVTQGCYMSWTGEVCWTQRVQQYGANGRAEQ